MILVGPVGISEATKAKLRRYARVLLCPPGLEIETPGQHGACDFTNAAGVAAPTPLLSASGGQ